MGAKQSCTCICTCGRRARSESIDKRKFWNQDKLQTVVNALVKNGVALKPSLIWRDTSERSKDIVELAIGRRLSPRSVYSSALYQKVSWRELARNAGAPDLKSIKPRNYRWPKEVIVKVLREMYAAGFELHVKGMRFNNTPEKSDLIEKVAGERIKSVSLYRRAKRQFGTWPAALTAAGINSQSVKYKRPSRAKSRYAHLPIQFETSMDGGKHRKVGVLGFAPRTPEEELASRYQVLFLEKTISAFPESEQNAVRAVITLIVSTDPAINLEEAIGRVSSQNERQIEVLKSAFAKIRKALS